MKRKLCHLSWSYLPTQLNCSSKFYLFLEQVLVSFLYKNLTAVQFTDFNCVVLHSIPVDHLKVKLPTKTIVVDACLCNNETIVIDACLQLVQRINNENVHYFEDDYWGEKKGVSNPQVISIWIIQLTNV